MTKWNEHHGERAYSPQARASYSAEAPPSRAPRPAAVAYPRVRAEIRKVADNLGLNTRYNRLQPSLSRDHLAIAKSTNPRVHSNTATHSSLPELLATVASNPANNMSAGIRKLNASSKRLIDEITLGGRSAKRTGHGATELSTSTIAQSPCPMRWVVTLPHNRSKQLSELRSNPRSRSTIRD